MFCNIVMNVNTLIFCYLLSNLEIFTKYKLKYALRKLDITYQKSILFYDLL